jgi:hypothetical protein
LVAVLVAKGLEMEEMEHMMSAAAAVKGIKVEEMEALVAGREVALAEVAEEAVLDKAVAVVVVQVVAILVDMADKVELDLLDYPAKHLLVPLRSHLGFIKLSFPKAKATHQLRSLGNLFLCHSTNHRATCSTRDLTRPRNHWAQQLTEPQPLTREPITSTRCPLRQPSGQWQTLGRSLQALG